MEITLTVVAVNFSFYGFYNTTLEIDKSLRSCKINHTWGIKHMLGEYII